MSFSIANDLVSVKPLSKPKPNLYYFDYVYDIREIRKIKLEKIFKNSELWKNQEIKKI